MDQDRQKNIKKLGQRQGAIKILINSIYGAFGNKWFYFYDPDIAQSITLQGQDLIKFSIKAINFYFKEKWHLDTELHKILGISQYKINKVEDDSGIYIDTDSVYVQFNSAINSIQADISHEDAIKMCIKIDKHRLTEYYEKCFNKWSKVFNTENQQSFQLENLSEKGFWIKKKNYAIKIAYEPNPKEEVLKQADRYLIIKGLEPIKSSYPIWARRHQTTFIEFLLKKGKTVKLEDELIPMIKEVWEEYKTLPAIDVSMNFHIRKYNKYVDSEEDCVLKKGATGYSKAVMHHNHLVLKNDMESIYSRIREGSKIKFYYSLINDKEIEVFAYNPGNYPSEFAPPVDDIQQFFVLIVEPINRILEAIGINKIDETLKRAVEFKTTKSKKPLTDDQLYPFHVINSETLDHEEVDKKFWKIIGNPDADISDEIFDEYLQTITKYGLNTVILINKNLKPFKKRISKNLGINVS